jgi:hypothetical protein
MGLTAHLRAALASAQDPRPFPMPPIRLSDDELDAVLAAARPIAVDLRDAFLQGVAHALAGHKEIGPGLVHRICHEQLRKYFDAPLETEPPEHGRRGRGKYG